MNKKYLLTPIICFIEVEAFSQFDWKYITTNRGVESYWRCRNEEASGILVYI